MNLETIGSALHLWVFVMSTGLVASFVFRRKPWVAFVWIPTTLAILCCSVVVFLRLTALTGLHGPDAGWGVMELIFLLPAFGASIGGLIACYLCRPREISRKGSTLVVALLISFAAIALWRWKNEANVEFRLSDATGATLSGVRVQFSLYEGGLGKGAEHIFSDSTGKFSFKLPRNESAELEIMPVSNSLPDIGSSPTFWNVNIGPLKNSRDKLEVRHSWQRPVGHDEVLNESFTEIIPFDREILIPLTLPPHGSLDPGPRRERIRAAFAAFQDVTPEGLDLSYVCRNLESIEFIPELIDNYRNKNEQRGSSIKGLSSITENLSILSKSCLKLQERLGAKPSPPRELYRDKITQLCVWAEIPYSSASNDMQMLERVQEKIAIHAKLLIDFALQEMPNDYGVVKILSELRQLARPILPELVTHLLNHPPTDMQSALSWSHVFFMLSARESELKSLRDSGNPLLQAAARDARPD
jgi:hypothetical protein